jgi:CRP-like cAMP-binding protein
MVQLNFLEQVDVFRQLTDDQLSMIRKFAEVVEFKRGDRIFAQGDPANRVWIVQEGDVELRGEPPGREADQRFSICFLSETQAYGWTCFVEPYLYRLSGYCASRWCKVIRLNREDLLKVFAEDPVIGFKVMEYLFGAVGKQFEQLQDQMARDRGIEVMSQW